MNDSIPLHGIFGGTFDPIHFGHLNTVKSILEQTGLASVRFIPSAIPPIREQPEATARQRLEMVEMAIESEPLFLADDRELKRSEPSYTFDTVLSLQTENPQTRFCLIIGLDALLGLERWYRWQELLDRIHFIVMARPGWTFPDPLPKWWQTRNVDTFDGLSRANTGKIHVINIDPVNISATAIRNGIKQGQDMSRLMPDAVWKYICENRLYE